MKVYISADIEGVAGIAAASETDMAKTADYQPFREQMAAEVSAACRGAILAGATQIWIKDAHGTGRNLLPGDLAIPAGCDVRLIRGWSGHPFAMVQEIDASFDALVCIGYHCAAGQAGNPLAHTISGKLFARVDLDGTTASELRLYALAAASQCVPLRFVSGDERVCDEARAFAEHVETVATITGRGPSVISLDSGEAIKRIEEGVGKSLRSKPTFAVPGRFPTRLIVEFRHAADAYARSFYPKVRSLSDRELELVSDDYLELLAFLRFAARYA